MKLSSPLSAILNNRPGRYRRPDDVPPAPGSHFCRSSVWVLMAANSDVSSSRYAALSHGSSAPCPASLRRAFSCPARQVVPLDNAVNFGQPLDRHKQMERQQNALLYPESGVAFVAFRLEAFCRNIAAALVVPDDKARNQQRLLIVSASPLTLQ